MARGASVGVVVQSYSDFISSTPIWLARGLAELGHRVVVVTTSASDDRAAPYPKGARDDGADRGYDVVHLPHLGVLRDNVLVRPTWRPFPTDLDCLIVHEDYPVLSGVAATWAWRRRVPYFLVSERYYYPTGLAVQTALRFLDRTWGRNLWQRAALGIYHTRACLHFFTEREILPPRTEVIPAVIDARAIERACGPPSPRTRPPASSPAEILTIARLTPYKGLEILLEAVAGLVRRGRPLRLRILGRGPDESALRTRARALGIGNVVSIDTRPIPHADIPRVFAASDIYAQPSRIEPFGSAAVEAMAAGLPVVASAVGGLLDTVDDPHTGFLVPPGDAGALAERLDALVADPDLRLRLGEAGQRRAVALFDYPVVAQTYSERIERLSG